MRRVLGVTAGTLLAGYLALTALLFFGQRALLFPAPLAARTPRAPGGTVVELPGPYGKAFATYVPARGGLPTFVFFHGNGEQLADTDPWAQALREKGVGFYGIEYPGYGLARGQPTSEESIFAVADAAIRYLATELHVATERTVLVGFSLGSGVATQMAHRGLGARLILLAPYTSISDIAARMLPMFPTRLLLRDRFDSFAVAPEVKMPVLIVHGTEDEVVPFALGRALAPRFPNARFEPVEGAHHMDMVMMPAILDRAVAFASDGSP